MSQAVNTSPQITPADFDLDHVLYCAVCFRPASNPFDEDSNDPQFFLTSCGHVVCIEHMFENAALTDLSGTHKCPVCRTRDVSILGLAEGQIPPDLSEYFRPMLGMLDDFVGAMKFQYENLTRAARHYKTRATDLEATLNRKNAILENVKKTLTEARAWREENEQLKGEVTRLRGKVTDLESELNVQASQSKSQRQPDGVSTVPQKRRSNSGPTISAKAFKDQLNARNVPRTSHGSVDLTQTSPHGPFSQVQNHGIHATPSRHIPRADPAPRPPEHDYREQYQQQHIPGMNQLSRNATPMGYGSHTSNPYPTPSRSGRGTMHSESYYGGRAVPRSAHSMQQIPPSSTYFSPQVQQRLTLPKQGSQISTPGPRIDNLGSIPGAIVANPHQRQHAPEYGTSGRIPLGPPPSHARRPPQLREQSPYLGGAESPRQMPPQFPGYKPPLVQPQPRHAMQGGIPGSASGYGRTTGGW